MTIEFKRAGDVMVFECPAFKIEVEGNGAERIEINSNGINSSSDFLERITESFKVLDMMIEHKAKRDGDNKVTEMNFKINVDTTDAEETIRELNQDVSGAGIPSRPFVKLEGIYGSAKRK